MSRYVHTQIQNAPIYRKADRAALRRIIGILIAVGGIAALLILATWQHVEAVRFGYKTDQLVREREKLETVQRQLELERATRRSPQVIEPLARRLGLIRPDVSQVIIVDGQRQPARGQTSGTNFNSTPAPAHLNDPGLAGAHRSGERLSENPLPTSKASRPRKSTRVEKDVRSEPETKLEKIEPPSAPTKAPVSTTGEPEIKPKLEPSGEKKTASLAETVTDPQKRKRPSKQGEPKP